MTLRNLLVVATLAGAIGMSTTSVQALTLGLLAAGRGRQ